MQPTSQRRRLPRRVLIVVTAAATILSLGVLPGVAAAGTACPNFTDPRYPVGKLIYSPYDNAVCAPDGFSCPQGYIPARDAAGRDTCLKTSPPPTGL
jgi:hypothetical protein